MSEIPPVGDPNQPPSVPPQYASYPRGPVAVPYGSADKLQALSEGYFGLNNVFIINVALSIGSRVLSMNAKTQEEALAILGGIIIVLGLIVGFASFPYNRKIAYGKDWAPGHAILASVLMALNSALCCGIIGYIVMQQLASSEIKKYGISFGLFGLKKKDVQARIDQMRAQPGPVPPTFNS